MDANSAAAHLLGLSLSASDPPAPAADPAADAAAHEGKMDVDVADPGTSTSSSVSVPAAPAAPRSSTDP